MDGRRVARYLGFAGLIPFYATAVGALLSDDLLLVSLLVQAQLVYGAVIASFLGAVHWGLAMAVPEPPGSRLFVSVLPGLAGWAIVGLLSAHQTFALALFIALFGVLYFYDRSAVQAGRAPAWYGALRGPLTALAMVAFGLSLLAVARLGP